MLQLPMKIAECLYKLSATATLYGITFLSNLYKKPIDDFPPEWRLIPLDDEPITRERLEAARRSLRE